MSLHNNAYDVIVSILSVVSFNPKRNNSAAIASPPSISWIFRHPSRSSFHATQSRSAETRADRFVSERKGSSPQTVPATIVSMRTPCSRSYEARKMPLSSKYNASDSSYDQKISHKPHTPCFQRTVPAGMFSFVKNGAIRNQKSSVLSLRSWKICINNGIGCRKCW